MKYYNSSNYKNGGLILSPEEETKYFLLCKNGDLEAKQKIIDSNYGLVIKLAKPLYFENVDDMDELVQEGMLGLCVAVEKFDINKGTKFSTYAKFWILKYLKDYVYKNHLIVVPKYTVILMAKISTFISDYSDINQKMPTKEIIMEKFGIDSTTYNRVIHALNLTSFVSLNKSSDDSSDLTNDNLFIDLIVDPDTLPDEKLVMESEIESIMVFFDRYLSPKEKDVLKCRMGFMGKSLTLDEVATKYGVTKERIRQIEAGALNILHQAYDVYVLNETGNSEWLKRLKDRQAKYQTADELTDIQYYDKPIKYNSDVTVVGYSKENETFIFRCNTCNKLWHEKYLFGRDDFIGCPKCNRYIRKKKKKN